MSSGTEKRGKKRSKAFYRKSTYGNKRARSGANVLEPGIKGFLVMCNSNESSAVKECYNILNEYADALYGQEQVVFKLNSDTNGTQNESSEDEDVEKAVQKEVDSFKNTGSKQRRFQNVLSKAKNCIFIRTTLENPVNIAVRIMEDIAARGLKRARYAARILPILGTCKANVSDIEKLALEVLSPVFAEGAESVPASYTVLFKARNNNCSTCGRTSVVPAVTQVVSQINSSVKFSWSDFEVAVLVEVVCTVCCVGVAPGYTRLRKYNLQELQQGPKCVNTESDKGEQPCEQDGLQVQQGEEGKREEQIVALVVKEREETCQRSPEHKEEKSPDQTLASEVTERGTTFQGSLEHVEEKHPEQVIHPEVKKNGGMCQIFSDTEANPQLIEDINTAQETSSMKLKGSEETGETSQRDLKNDTDASQQLEVQNTG